MFRTISRHTILLIVLFTLAFVASCSRTVPVRYDVRSEGGESFYGKGCLKYDQGMPILVLEGTPAEMGLQYGVLLREPLKKSVIMLEDLIKGSLEERSWYQRMLFPLWMSRYAHSMGKRIPERYLEELRGISQGSGIDYDLVLFVATGAGIFENMGCTSAVVKTREGILHGRNMDWMPLWLGSTPLIIEYRPSDRQRYTSFSMVGVPGCVQGINDKGITLTTNIAFRKWKGTSDNDGMPIMFKNREVMENADSLDAAQELFSSWHTDEAGWMITMSSLSGRDGAVIEMFDNNFVRTGLRDDRVYVHNILFNPALLGSAALSRRYTEIQMGLGEYNESRHNRSEAVLGKVKDVDTMLDYLSSTDVFGIDDILMSDNASVNNSCTINTMVFDPAHGCVYYSSSPGFSAFSTVYKYNMTEKALTPYRKEKPLNKETAAGMALYSRILDLWIMRKYSDIVQAYDVNMDNVPVILSLAVKSWLKEPSSRKVIEMISGVDRHIKRHPEYGLYYLFKGQLLAASGKKKESVQEFKAAVDTLNIGTEDRLIALLGLCDVTEGTEKKEYIKRYVKDVDRISETWLVEKNFAGPWKKMKKELE